MAIDDTCETFVADCHVRTAVELVSHTWDPVVLSALRLGPVRRADLLPLIADISDKSLTDSLRRLGCRGLIRRVAAAPPGRGVDYELTEFGASFAGGPLAEMAKWAASHQDELANIVGVR